MPNSPTSIVASPPGPILRCPVTISAMLTINTSKYSNRMTYFIRTPPD